MDYRLAQRGRALIDFEVGIRHAAGRLQRELEQDLAAKDITADTLPENMDERHDVIAGALGGSPRHRAWMLLGDWGARQHGRACEAAFEEIRPAITPQLEALGKGGTTLTASDDFTPPTYWSDVWFHRTTGGWDASDYNGFVHGELVHRRYVARIFPGNIYAQRHDLLKELPRAQYGHILELGTSSGHYTVALADRFPDAQIVGVDPSERMLEQARRVGNERGAAWDLLVGVGEETGLADASFDLVTSYAIHHELPPRIIQKWFEEAFRLLVPGGDLLMADVPRTRDLDRMTAWRFDWAAKWGGEPFWRAAGLVDLAAGARAAGFVDVRTGGIGPSGNPYFVYGRKPDA